MIRYLPLALALVGCAAPPDAPTLDAVFADSDAPPPASDLRTVLLMEPVALTWGQPSTIEVSGAAPGEQVGVVASLAGPGVGPCPPALGGLCLGVSSPIPVGVATADAFGVARITTTPPACAPLGTPLWLQAGVARGVLSELSSVVSASPPDESTFADDDAPSAFVHVAPGGTGDGSSAGSPLGSVEAAAALATPGTAILLHGGTYTGGISIADLRGTADDPIWLGSAPGESAVIQGGSVGLELIRPAWLVVHDLEITLTGQNGLKAHDGNAYADMTAAHDVVFRDLDIHHIGGTGNQNCLSLQGVNDFRVLDSSFEACGGAGAGAGVYQLGCHHGVIADSAFTDNHGVSVIAKGGSEDIEIRRNTFVNPGERGVTVGGKTGLGKFRPPLSTIAPNAEAWDIRVVSNVIVNAQSAAIGFVGCVDCIAANNTMVDTGRWVVRVLQETHSDATYTFLPVTNGAFTNNIVSYDDGAQWTLIDHGATQPVDAVRYEQNLWYAHDDPAVSAQPPTEIGGIVGLDPAFTTGVEIDGTSPAAGAGVAWMSAPVRDAAGACFGTPPSIGAYDAP